MNPVDPKSAAGATARLTAPAARPPRAEMLRLSHELQAVFLRQLFAAMRQNGVSEGASPKGPGEEMFTSMLDDRLATEAANHLQSRLGEALYRQLTRNLPADPPAETR